MGATADYITNLSNLKSGDLGRLRQLSGLDLDETVDGFDLFAGLWWPLRQKNKNAPNRRVAWLIAKLYAFCPLEQAEGCYFVSQLRRCEPYEIKSRERFRKKFDELLLSPLENLEPYLQWALKEIASLKEPRLDWIKLTDDLSIWEKGEYHSYKKDIRQKDIRLFWTEKYLKIENNQNLFEGVKNAD